MLRLLHATFGFGLAVFALTGCTATTTNGGSSGSSGDGTGSSSGGASSSSSGGASSGGGTPCTGEGIKVLAGCTAPQGTYVPQEGAERDRIANEMWTVMTNAPCWYMKDSVQQYVFYGEDNQLKYTFWGANSDSKSFGTLGVTSVGRYEDKNAAALVIRNENWLLVIHQNTLTLGKVLNGQPYVETYIAQQDGRCT